MKRLLCWIITVAMFATLVFIPTGTVFATEGEGDVDPAPAVTAPARVHITAFNKSIPTLVVKWKTLKCDGYQIKVSSSKSFPSTSTRYYTFNSGTRYAYSLPSKSLKNGKKYYVKVRAFRLNNDGKKVYGKWSDYWSRTVKKSGWRILKSGKRYYFKNGVKMKGTAKVRMVYKNGYGKNSVRYETQYFSNSDGRWLGKTYQMANKAIHAKSKTNQLVIVSRTSHRVGVYKRDNSKSPWYLVRLSLCATGGKDGKTTPAGSFTILSKGNGFGHYNSYWVWNNTRFYKTYHFHSVLYSWWNRSKVITGMLEGNISNGCIRMNKSSATYLRDNCRIGTKVIIY